jgi:hypothetical protein
MAMLPVSSLAAQARRPVCMTPTTRLNPLMVDHRIRKDSEESFTRRQTKAN